MTWLIQTFYENQNKEEHMMNTDKRTVAFQVPGELIREVQGLPAGEGHQAERLLPGLHPQGPGGGPGGM